MQGENKSMDLTHTGSILKFLFSSNSEFNAMSVNGGNCFVHTLSLIAFSKKKIIFFKKQVVIES